MSGYNRNPYQLRSLLQQPSGSRPGYTHRLYSQCMQPHARLVHNGSVVSTTGMRRKPKRNRTAFETNQLNALEDEYVKDRYLDRNRRYDLASKLNLGERTIKIWFQNRRMKEKKDKAEEMQNCIVLDDSNSPINNYKSIPDLESKYQLPEPVLQANGMYFYNDQQYQGWVPYSQPQIHEPYVTSPYYPGDPSYPTYTPDIQPPPYPYPQEQPMVYNYMNMDNSFELYNNPVQQPTTTNIILEPIKEVKSDESVSKEIEPTSSTSTSDTSTSSDLSDIPPPPPYPYPQEQHMVYNYMNMDNSLELYNNPVQQPTTTNIILEPRKEVKSDESVNKETEPTSSTSTSDTSTTSDLSDIPPPPPYPYPQEQPMVYNYMNMDNSFDLYNNPIQQPTTTNIILEPREEVKSDESVSKEIEPTSSTSTSDTSTSSDLSWITSIY